MRNNPLQPTESETPIPPMPVIYTASTWVYKTITRDLSGEGAFNEDDLNELGRDGWELVGIVAFEQHVTYTFKQHG